MQAGCSFPHQKEPASTEVGLPEAPGYLHVHRELSNQITLDTVQQRAPFRASMIYRWQESSREGRAGSAQTRQLTKGCCSRGGSSSSRALGWWEGEWGARARGEERGLEIRHAHNTDFMSLIDFTLCAP